MPNQELALRDIHLPADVSWWPPAPGWWLILALLIAIVLFYVLIKTKKHSQKLHKSSQQAFYRLKVDYHLNKDHHKVIEEISMLLRRIAMSYYDRNNIASVNGEEWLAKLDQLSSNESPSFLSDTGRALIKAPYQKNPDIDIEKLLAICENWVKSLPTSKHAFDRQQAS